jgi:hypothetical protein
MGTTVAGAPDCLSSTVLLKSLGQQTAKHILCIPNVFAERVVGTSKRGSRGISLESCRLAGRIRAQKTPTPSNPALEKCGD